MKWTSRLWDCDYVYGSFGACLRLMLALLAIGIGYEGKVQTIYSFYTMISERQYYGVLVCFLPSTKHVGVAEKGTERSPRRLCYLDTLSRVRKAQILLSLHSVLEVQESNSRGIPRLFCISPENVGVGEKKTV